MKRWRNIAWICLAVLCSAAIVTSSVYGEVPDENRACLQCHSKRGIIKKFENNESISVFINPAGFSSSVHAFLKCSHCHTEFSAENHPTREFKSKEHYQVRSARTCRRCHTDDQLMQKAVHGRILSGEEKTPRCAHCHDSHYVQKASQGKGFTSEEHFCLKCHERDMVLRFQNGETVSLRVDPSLLKASMHSNISCSDCHFGFSSDEHPQRTFRTKRDFVIASSETCRRCHFDKYTKTMEGIHYSMLSQGNLNAPVCTDCHGGHAIPHMVKEKTFIAKRCQRCHAEVYETYAKSVHGNALFNEQNQDVPICIDCHTAHNIENPFGLDYREKIPEMCGNCHANKVIAKRYGLSTDVTATYLSDFHGVTLKFYKMQKEVLSAPVKPIAVCTDCHGTHDIQSMVGTPAALVKANLAKKCRKCHERAPEDFPAAWLSHYEASFIKSPLVFIIKIAFKIFIPIMLAGLVLQILLHVWRYAVNR